MRNRKIKPCNCCGALTVLDTQDDICPVCFWKNSQFDKYITEPSRDNIQVTPEQAKKNYIAFGAFDRSALPYVREPEPSEIGAETLVSKGYPADRKPNEWYREIAKYMKMKDFFIEISSSSNSYCATSFVVKDGCYEWDCQWMNDDPNGKHGLEAMSTHNKFRKHFAQYMKHPGEHYFRYENGEFAEYRCFDDLEYNSGLYERYTDDVIFIREYGLKPARTEKMEDIEKMMKKAERTRKSLLYACKYKNTELIKQLAPTSKPTQLNKTEAYTNTAIGFCARNDDLEGFKAMAEAGADMTKKVGGKDALSDAYSCSPAIMIYVHDNYPDIFKARFPKGFGAAIAAKWTDRAALDRLYEIGMNCSEEHLSGDFEPLLFKMIDNNNPVGVQFLYDKGFDLANIRRAERYGGRNAIEEADRCGIKNEAYDLLKTLIAKQKQ
ncbi:MAG: hypothetical protein K6B74_03615 [Ruminococcus sp.]|nr:hypothetical protein [Ruminococcus sp.]